MRIRAWFGLALLLMSFAVFAAGGISEVRKQVEASMLVTGTVVVDSEGKLKTLTLDHEDALPTGVVKLIRGQSSQWRFEPVMINGKAVVAKTDMSLRVIAKALPNDEYAIRIGGASFGTDSPNPNEIIRSEKLTPPKYPRAAGSIGASGTAYVVAKVGRNGKVEDAIVEQVNLKVVARERDMTTLRRIFADNARAIAKKWTFHPPTEGDGADDKFWTVRVPVKYNLGEARQEPMVYGKPMFPARGSRSLGRRKQRARPSARTRHLKAVCAWPVRA